jgi:hypothetical protein
MALADLTKQLAQQAILSATEKKEEKPAPPDTVGSILLAQIHAMQKALKEDEELAVFFQSGTERIRIMEIYFPSWKLAVLSGLDADRVLSRAVMPAEAVQLIIKVGKVAAGAKPARVGLVSPKA